MSDCDGCECEANKAINEAIDILRKRKLQGDYRCEQAICILLQAQNNLAISAEEPEELNGD